MKRRGSFACILLCIAGSMSMGQEAVGTINHRRSPMQEQEETVPRQFRLIVYPTIGDAVYGLFHSFSGDTLLVASSGGIVPVTPDNVVLISLKMLSSSTAALEAIPLGILTGLVIAQSLTESDQGLTYYSGPYATSVSGQPGFYVTKDGAFAYVALGLVGGALFGWFGQLIEKGEEEMMFRFDEDGDQQAKEWNRLRENLLRRPSDKVFRFAVQAGHVFTRQGHPQHTTTASSYYSDISSFTFLRSLRLAYSINDFLEVGPAIVFFGEPILHSSYSQTAGSVLVNDHFDATGYYAEGTITPFAADIPDPLILKVGLGIGVASVEYVSEINDQNSSPRRLNEISGTYFSVELSTTVYLEITRTLMLGLIGDYVTVPGKKIPGIPEVNLSEGIMGNGSIGFSIAYRF